MSSYEVLLRVPMKFSTAKLRNNFDFSKLLAFIFTIWCLFTLFFYHLTHGRNRNEVFSADLSAISISVISVISVFREPSWGTYKTWGTYKMRNMVWVNKKAFSQRRESFLVIVACVSITDTLMIYIPCEEEEEDEEETGMLTDAAPSAFLAATSLPSRV